MNIRKSCEKKQSLYSQRTSADLVLPYSDHLHNLSPTHSILFYCSQSSKPRSFCNFSAKIYWSWDQRLGSPRGIILCSYMQSCKVVAWLHSGMRWDSGAGQTPDSLTEVWLRRRGGQAGARETRAGRRGTQDCISAPLACIPITCQ